MTKLGRSAVIAVLAGLCLAPLAMTGCVVVNTGDRVRSMACRYVSVDVSRPKDGVVYVVESSPHRREVYMQAPEVTYSRRPYLLTREGLGSSVTPVEGVSDTGAWCWVRMQDIEWHQAEGLREAKNARGRCPAWNETDVAAYRLHFELLPQAPAAETLASAERRPVAPLPAPQTADEFGYESRIFVKGCSQIDRSAWYPLVCIVSVPLSAADVVLSIPASIIGAVCELIRTPTLE